MAAAEARYELLDHTADVGLDARGATLADVFAQAAEGMYALMVEPAGVREVEQRTIEVAAEDRERLLVAWLLELLFLTESEGLVFRRFEVEVEGETRLRGRAWGEPLDPDRHELGVAVKAVTYHLLEVAQVDGGYRARVIFDI